MRRCDRWPLTNRLLYAAAIRFSAARRPCTSLLDMLNVRRIFWCRFGTRFTAQLCKRWLFADRRRCALRHIVRKPNFRLLRIKVIPRRRFFCAGFLCSLYIGATALFLCGWRTLALFWRRVCSHILRALAWRILCQRRGSHNMTLSRLLWHDRWRWGTLLCGLLDIDATGLLLRCGCRCALWLLRVWPGAYILRALTRCIFCRWHGHCGMLRLLRRDRLRWRGRFCGLLNISTSGLFLRCGYRCALRRRCI